MPRMNLSRRSKILLAVVVALIVLLMIFSSLTGAYVNWLWFRSLGFGGVYTTVFWTRVVLFLLFGVVMTAVILGNVLLAYRLRPAYRPASAEQQNLERYRLAVEPFRRLILIGLGLISFLAAGMAGQSQWQVWQLFLNGGRFGITDPQFHKDVSFYAWDYPAYRAALGFGLTAVIFAFLLVLGMHYFTGAIRLQTPGRKVSGAARRHLTALAFVFVVFKALSYWLDRYGLLFSHRSTFTGASYTDVHASLPSKTILFWIAILLAAGLVASLWLESSLLPGVAFVSMLVLSILISGVYPAILQQVSVKPNASSKEAPYIKHSIDSTRAAYGIETGPDVTYSNYSVTQTPSTSALVTTNPTVSDIRVLDPNVVSQTFTALQRANRSYYGFPAKLDVDRYTVKDNTSDYIIGVRELDKANLQGNQNNWINQHTAFTHGYGFVAAPANVDVTNDPTKFTEQGIPITGPLGLTQPDVYYGELMPSYSIVGAKGQPREQGGLGKSSYGSDGGVALSSVLTRLAFAVHYKQTNFLLNDAASAKGARIIFNRDPRQMVQKAAPFLKIDSDPYPIVDSASGHIVWMVDGYTTMNNFPYSQRNSLSALTNDSLSSTGRTARQPNDSINYIRNSVKATIDAYTGKLTLYSWDGSDPVLKAWSKIFPKLLKPASAMPQTIRDHVRYPEDLFEVQRSLIGTYHVDDPGTWYSQQQKWTPPGDPFVDGTKQPPFYVVASAPGSTTQSQFQLTSPMTVNGKPNLAAYVTVSCDPGPNYGKFTVLQIPEGIVVNGPEQVANLLNTEPTISKDLSQFNAAGGGSSVIHGNLLTLPVGDSFLYIDPLYLQGTNTGSYPKLERVLAVYGEKKGYGPTLSDALANLDDTFVGRNIGTGATGGGNTTTPPPTSPAPSGSTSPSGGATSPANPTLPQLLTQLDQAYSALTAAYASGDPSKISAAQGKVLDLVRRITVLQGAASPSR